MGDGETEMGRRESVKEALDDMEDCGIIDNRMKVSLVPRPAVFLDRDGVLIADGQERLTGSIRDIQPLPGTRQAVTLLRHKGFLVCMATNQADIARGVTTEDRQNSINEHLSQVLGGLDGIAMCPHGPDDNCDCRKPKPSMLRDLARELNIDLDRSWMVGDMDTDIEAGVRAGTMTASVSQTVGHAGYHADVSGRTLIQVARMICALTPVQLMSGNTTCG